MINFQINTCFSSCLAGLKTSIVDQKTWSVPYFAVSPILPGLQCFRVLFRAEKIKFFFFRLTNVRKMWEIESMVLGKCEFLVCIVKLFK